MDYVTKKVLTPEAAAKALVEAVQILNTASGTAGLVHRALMRFRERGVKFTVGGIQQMDAEADRVFDEACEILRLMSEQIPQRLETALMDGECESAQNAPSVETVQ